MSFFRSLTCVASLALVSLLEGQVPTFTQTASVHDPSVIKVGERFYVFGSHGASAWSTDLRNWNQVATGVNVGNPRHFVTFQSELSELIEWTQADTLWAADVYQMDDGKFYYYYNVWTDHLNYRSYMGLAVADDIEGPYIDKGELLKGGTGVAGFNANVHPNTIDPTLYRDTEDTLWMVYGSYSGGIFVLEMDDETGFQKPGQSWGTKLLGGVHQLIEGPFIEYNEETGFYYLFLSYGGLAAADGYNMRVFRSENPDGPFYDPAGNDMTQVTGAYANYGLKLAGNWQFTPVEGKLAQSVTGYRSPGHNSVMKDPETGKWFNFFHTRFEGRGEQHEIRVHQLFFNEDGWPVMAPHRYAGETQGTYATEEIAGSYKVINHGKDISGDLKTATVLGLQAGGGLVGASGSWELVDGKAIRILMGGTLFKGVVSEMWDNENRMWVNSFTAISSQGESLWGSEVAIADRTGEIDLPELESVDNAVMGVEDTFSLTLTNLSPNSDLILAYKVVEGPQGFAVNAQTGVVNWKPLPSQAGEVYTIRIQVYDILDPNLADEVSFYLYVSGGYELNEAKFDFETQGTGGVLDKDGVPTGLTARLSGTGSGFSNADANLSLDVAGGRLLLTSTQADFNGQAGVGGMSAVGMKLSELGFDGDQDFTVLAEFGAIEGLEDVDQVGLFVGSSATTLTRAGIFMSNTGVQGLGVHTQSGQDASATFDTSSYDLSDGLTVAIYRESGVWTYVVDGVTVNPGVRNATFLDSLSDLTVGVFAITPLNETSKTVALKSLEVSVLSDQLRASLKDEWIESHFGVNPANGIAGDGDDPDKDGRVNLVEYALGTDPMKADGEDGSQVEIEGGKLVWTLNRTADPALIFEVRLGTSPTGANEEVIWSSIGASNLEGPAKVSVDLPEGESRGVFLELTVDSLE